MATKTTTLEANPREETGKGAARSIRREGRIPAILYGHGRESLPLTVDAVELAKLVSSISVDNTLVDLEVDGESTKVLIREVQRHPFRSETLHVDFFEIAMDEKIHVDVPVVIEGVPTGVKDRGGVLDHMLREIEVYCLPSRIPERIVVDVSELDIGDAIHVGELDVPDVEILTEADRSVVAVAAPTVIEEPEEEEEEELLEPELVGAEEGEEAEPGEEAPSGEETEA